MVSPITQGHYNKRDLSEIAHHGNAVPKLLWQSCIADADVMYCSCGFDLSYGRPM